MNIWLGEKRGYFTDWITQRWVQFTGQKVNLSDEDWLLGPIGRTRRIGEDFFGNISEEMNLDVVKNVPDSGLLKNLNVLRNDSLNEIHPKVTDFYEHTINYGFDVWSEWSGFFKPFGWLLAIIFSRRLQQLNVPLSPLDTSRGVTSEVIQLKDKSDEVIYTVWLRKKIESKDVIYAGCYMTCIPKNKNYNCIKVVFPLPNGNATVIMTPEVLEDGSLRLTSKGEKFGDPGFYFLAERNGDLYDVKYLKTMRETIHVYVDENGQLRTDHLLTIWKRKFLKLHYKIYLKVR